MSTECLPPPLDRLDRKDQTRRTLGRGETLFVQDCPTAGLYYLASGTIDLKRSTTDGHSIVIHRARAGDTFAEASLFSESYHCTATAAVESHVIECRRTAITALLNTNINFTLTMTSRFAAQIQHSRRRVELLSIRTADERILAALSDGLLVEDIVTFADVIGLAHETVYRALARLSQNGQIVKSARGQYRLVAANPPVLPASH